MYNNRLYFSSYKPVHQPTTIPSKCGIFFAIGIGNIPHKVESRNRKKSEVLLFGRFYVFGLFTILISGSELIKKGYYLHSNDQTINLCSDNMEIASYFIQDALFTLKLHKTPRISNAKSHTSKVEVATSSSTTLVKIWHRRLKYPKYSNLKRLDSARGIEISNLKFQRRFTPMLNLHLCKTTPKSVIQVSTFG